MITATGPRGLVKVEWIDLGEGLCGEYNPDDPDDIALLRYDAYVRPDAVDKYEMTIEAWVDETTGNPWVIVRDSSFCTNTPVDTPDHILQGLAQIIADSLEDSLGSGYWKSVSEQMSWISPHDYKEELT